MELLERLLLGPPRGCSMWQGARVPMPRHWPGAGTGCMWLIRCRSTWKRAPGREFTLRPWHASGA